jgi:predicted nucleic acid-binding protein
MGSLRSSAQAHDLGHLATESPAVNRNQSSRVPVIDSSLVVALALQDARALSVQALLRTWIAGDVELHAPALLPYEVASGLTQAVAAGKLMADRVGPAWQSAMDIPLTYHLLGVAGEAAVAIARRLERQSAYDAAYLALALALRSEVWTFDRKLAHNAGNLGYPVMLVESAA